jgi:hypothetical protein
VLSEHLFFIFSASSYARGQNSPRADDKTRKLSARANICQIKSIYILFIARMKTRSFSANTSWRSVSNVSYYQQVSLFSVPEHIHMCACAIGPVIGASVLERKTLIATSDSHLSENGSSSRRLLGLFAIMRFSRVRQCPIWVIFSARK